MEQKENQAANIGGVIKFYERGWMVGDLYLYDNGLFSLAAGNDKDAHIIVHSISNSLKGEPFFFVMVTVEGRRMTISDLENTYHIRAHEENRVKDCVRMSWTDLDYLITQLS